MLKNFTLDQVELVALRLSKGSLDESSKFYTEFDRLASVQKQQKKAVSMGGNHVGKGLLCSSVIRL